MVGKHPSDGETEGRVPSNLFWTQLRPKGKAEDLAKSKKADHGGLRTAPAITHCHPFRALLPSNIASNVFGGEKNGGVVNFGR